MEIPEIKSRLTLSMLFNYYGLKPDKSLRLLCPFHPDKTPSLQVYYKTQTAIAEKNPALKLDSSKPYNNFLFIYKKGSIQNNDIDDFKKNLNKSFNKKDCKVIFMEYTLLTDSVFQKQIIDTIKDRHVDFIIALQNFTEQTVTENGPRQIEAFRFKKMITTKRRDYSFVGYKADEKPYKQIWKCNCNRIDFIMDKLSVKKLAKCILTELENGQVINVN